MRGEVTEETRVRGSEGRSRFAYLTLLTANPDDSNPFDLQQKFYFIFLRDRTTLPVDPAESLAGKAPGLRFTNTLISNIMVQIIDYKQREEMLKHLQTPVADPETGEMIYPAKFKSTQVLSVTLAGL
ncbi:MAG: hypothetical protein PHD61_02255 [Bacteroidales bacterium]|nr:hypothetical protein [Lentimicrobiaceae bacterium]MDD5694111.1 hypothetical protein [Bacteroidales bacterium]